MQWLKAKRQYLDQLSAETTKVGYSWNMLQFESYLESIDVPIPLEVEAVTKEHIERYLTYLDRDRQCKASTCQRHYYALSSFFTYAWNHKWISVKPTTGIVLKEVDKAKPVFITKFECDDILGVIGKPIISMAITCLFETGLRVAECLALQIGAIDFEKSTLFVKEGKGGKDRTVPITEDFAKKLVHYLQHDRPVVEGSYVFATKRTGKLSAAYLNREIKKAVLTLGWKQHITCHTLRHSYASQKMNAGIPIVQIQQWLGHESLASTGIYAHLEMDRAINDYISGQ